MIRLFLAAQLAAALPNPDSTYSSAALRAFIADAARSNRFPPTVLQRYDARVESELSLLLRDTLGRERVAQVEQIAMSAAWERSGRYDLRVIGYRSQSVGVPYSALSFARSWTLPYLYGDRLTLGVEMGQMSSAGPERTRPDSAVPASQPDADSSREGRRSPRSRASPLRVVHPLATDRDQFYRFNGGDTVAQLRTHGRLIPIVRVLVTPHFDSAARAARIGAFEGEIDFDATRRQIVRMRGQFVTSRNAPRGRASALARLPGIVAVAYVEFVNAEVDGLFWLPAFQRSEFQAGFAPLGSVRSVFRLVSRFAGIRAEAADVPTVAVHIPDSIGRSGAAPAVEADSTPRFRRRLSYAPSDSVSRYAGWQEPLGTATGRVSGSDFDDLAPDVWRADGPPRVDLMPAKFDDVFRFNRVEGLYTGTAVTVRFRNAMPGVSARAHGGWAWRESTVRGGVSLALRRGPWTTSLRAERSLASTNDFTLPLEGSGVSLVSLFGGVDDQDYVDRRLASIGVARTIGSVKTALAAMELGVAEDRGEVARLRHGIIGAGAPFRSNRGASEGRYARGAAVLELHPDVTGVFLEPGMGAVLSYEIARGELAWQRAEVTLAARRSWSDVTLSGRAQGGALIGRHLPPQTLFELGGEGALPGYGYKEFAGDRAATGGMLVSYAFPVMRRPWRLVRSLMMPGLSPGLAAGIQAGWAEASSADARLAIDRLDPLMATPCDPSTRSDCPSPISRSTDGVRATVDARVTFFGGLLGVGVARPVDHRAPWRLVFRVGQEF